MIWTMRMLALPPVAAARARRLVVRIRRRDRQRQRHHSCYRHKEACTFTGGPIGRSPGAVGRHVLRDVHLTVEPGTITGLLGRAEPQMTVVLNWFEELQARVPVR